MTEIERIARAMCPPNADPDTLVFHERLDPPAWAPMGLSVVPKGVPLWMVYVEVVRRLLAAIREPTRAMVEAGERVPIDVIISIRTEYVSGAAAVWTAMIDTLLAEGDAPAAERSTKCAACGGSGSVPSGYAPGMGPATSACRICGGTG